MDITAGKNYKTLQTVL